jgi:hypothetical protein
MTRLPFRVLLVALLVPVTITLLATALQLAWLPELPATIAVHWSFDGRPDNFGPAWTMPLGTAVLGLGLPILFTLILAGTVRPPGPTATQKVLGAASVFATVDLAIAMTASLALQRQPAPGLPPIGALVGLALLAGLLLAAGGWFAMPRAVAGRTGPAERVAPVPVAPGERVAWVGYARFRTGVLVALVATVLLATAGAAFGVAASGMWWPVILPVILVVALLTTTAWRVRVDARGLDVRALLGWPAIHVAPGDLEAAGTTDVVPLGEFGGYGLRFGFSGRIGVITRGGEALEVQRRGGRAVIVTVDDAATAAGLLEAYAAATPR